MGIVTRGYILGIDEQSPGKSDLYNSSAVCLSLNAELLKIDRDILNKALAS